MDENRQYNVTKASSASRVLNGEHLVVTYIQQSKLKVEAIVKATSSILMLMDMLVHIYLLASQWLYANLFFLIAQYIIYVDQDGIED